MKKYIWMFIVGGVALVVMAFLIGRYALPNTALSSLPAPEVAEGQRGELLIDKNINEENIDQYLGRSDSVYRDMRMLKDPGNYEAIGGDSYLSGFVEGFEVVPLPYLVNVTGLPEAVGETFAGNTLFTVENGAYTPNYEESLAILEALFPKDKIIFLMCGGGGYAGMMKNMLVALGWEADKIYNVGGYWYYNGEHNVQVKRTNSEGKTVYDFYKVPYHDINLYTLTPVKIGQEIDISPTIYDEMTAEGRSFLLLVDQDGCTTGKRLKEFLEKLVSLEVNKTGGFFYRMMFEQVKKTTLHEFVKYYPSVVVISSGKVVGYLRTDADEDAPAYNNYDDFKNWILQYLR